MICNTIEYLNVGFVCLRSCEDYKLWFWIRDDRYSGHKSFCKTVAVMFLRVSRIFLTSRHTLMVNRKKSFLNNESLGKKIFFPTRICSARTMA